MVAQQFEGECDPETVVRVLWDELTVGGACTSRTPDEADSAVGRTSLKSVFWAVNQFHALSK